MAKEKSGSDAGPQRMKVNSAQLPFVESSNAVTIFADDMRGAAIVNGIAKINLVEIEVSPPDERPAYKQVARLLIPLNRLKAWGDYLHKLARDNPAGEEESGESEI